MEAIKKVFKHGDDNTSPSGHFKPGDDAIKTHDSSSRGHSDSAPHHQSASLPGKVAQKAAGVDPSHAAGARTDSTPRHHDNAHHTGTHVVGSENTSHHNNPLSSTSNGRDNDRGLVGGNTTTGTHGSSSHGGIAGKAEQAFQQHAQPPSHGHNIPSQHTHLDQEHAKQATHDHKHLAPVTHEKHQVHETEEVTRQREVDRHIHHVQHHVQPVHDTQHKSEVHHEQVHPTTRIEEKHSSTAQDTAALASLAKHHDKTEHAEKDRVIVDKGEIVNEQTSHHVHHVVQPVIKRDVHEHHTVHTVIPTQHTVHEAPVVHQSVEHEPMNIKDFVAGGGDLKSKLTHQSAGILSEGECERKVDGPAESLLEKLHLKDNHTSAATGAAGQSNAGSATGTHGLTGGNHGSPVTHGLTGNHGTTGTQGVTGSHGLTGNHGTTGTQGVTGSHGLTGNHENRTL